MRNPLRAWYKYGIGTDCLQAALLRVSSSMTMNTMVGIPMADNKLTSGWSSAACFCQNTLDKY